MLNTVKRYAFACAISVVVAFAGSATQAAPTTRVCVPLTQIDETPVVDDQTILIMLRGGDFKRIDLLAKCSGLKLRGGFTHRTWSNDICTTDVLNVYEPAGATCMIDRILDIDKAETKKLLGSH